MVSAEMARPEYRNRMRFRHAQWLTISIFLILLFSCTGDQRSEQLEPSRPITRSIAAGQRHSFKCRLFMGRYVRLAADQQGIDIALTILDPHGRSLYEVDRWDSLSGPETISFIPPLSGIYEVVIRPVNKKATSGAYTVQLTEPATPPEPTRISALLSALAPYNEAQRLRREEVAASGRKAVVKYREALPLLEKAGDPLWQASALTYIAEVLDALGERRDAFGIHQRALPLWEQAREPDGQAETLHNIGVDQYSFGEVRQALKSYEAALPLWQAAHDQLGEGATLSTIGLVYQVLGDYQSFQAYEVRALRKAESVKDYGWQAHIIHYLAMGRLGNGDPEGALTQFQRALEISKKSDERWLDNHVLHHIGEVYLALRRYDLAETTLRTALAKSKEYEDILGEATTLMHLGAVLDARGDKTGALDHFRRASSLRKTASYRLGEAQCDERIGEVQFSMTRYREARDSFEHARALSHEIGELRSEATALNSLAKVDRETGDLERAREEALESLRLVELLRTNIRSPELRASFFSTTHDFYQTGIDVLMQISKKPGLERYLKTALEVNERARARSLLELLTESGVHIREGVPPSLLAEEQSVLEALSVKSERHLQLLGQKHRPGEAVQLSREVRELSDRLQATQARIRLASPQYAALTQPSPSAVQTIQTSLGPNTLLLEYALGETRSYLWAVSLNKVAAFELPGRTAIESLVRRFLDITTERTRRLAGETPARRHARITRADKQYPAAASALSKLLVSPVASMLREQRLILVTDGALQYLPFATLPDPQPENEQIPLIWHHEIVGLPSASTISVLRQRTATVRQAKQLALFADPVFSTDDSRFTDRSNNVTCTAETSPRISHERAVPSIGRLLSSSQEAQLILRRVSRTARFEATGFSATLDTLHLVGLEQFRMVHFSTHGLVDTENPEVSGLVFSLIDECGRPRNGLLGLEQIFNLRLTADFAVLSACNTALGQEIKGEGLVGMLRGFLYAGARSVIASLWEVDDVATSELMDSFYGGIIDGHLSSAAALRAAQLEMWKKGTPPYFWGGFVINGEWK